MFTAVISWLFGNFRARRKYNCAKHGSSEATWVLTTNNIAHRRCMQCHLDATKKAKNDH